MLPVESGTLLRIVIFSAFVGFVLFCASYATHVWLKRNRSNSSAAGWMLKSGALLVLAGLLGAGSSWALNRFVDRSGIVDGGALFVVHARRDGHLVMTPRQDVGENDVIAQYHPPALADQLKVIDSQSAEARARIETLRVRPVEIDPALLHRQQQLRAQAAQQLQFQVEYARATRELDRTHRDATAQSERERNQIATEIATLRTVLDGLQPQLRLAAARLQRATTLRRQGLTTLQLHDERAANMVALTLEQQRLASAIAGLAARIALVDQQAERAAAAHAAQHADLEAKAADTATRLANLEAAQADIAAAIAHDHIRAAARKEAEIEVAQRQVATLSAERGRAIAAHQVTAPFAGRVVYRNASPGLAAEGAPVLALSTGLGFVANIALPASEIDSLATAGPVTLALEHPVLKKYFTGEFRTADATSVEPGRTVAVFDAQLPHDAIALLGPGRPPVKVRLLWQPPLLQSFLLHASLLLLVAGALLMLADRLRGTLRLPLADHKHGTA